MTFDGFVDSLKAKGYKVRFKENGRMWQFHISKEGRKWQVFVSSSDIIMSGKYYANPQEVFDAITRGGRTGATPGGNR